MLNFTRNPYMCVEGSCGTNVSVVNLASMGDKIQPWTMVVGIFTIIALVLFVVSLLVF